MVRIQIRIRTFSKVGSGSGRKSSRSATLAVTLHNLLIFKNLDGKTLKNMFHQEKNETESLKRLFRSRSRLVSRGFKKSDPDSDKKSESETQLNGILS
jgi:hypothetical protein